MENAYLLMIYLIGLCAVLGLAGFLAEFFDWS